MSDAKTERGTRAGENAEHEAGLYCNECGEAWPCPSVDHTRICPTCRRVIPVGMRHTPFNGNQMFACSEIAEATPSGRSTE